jgi:hypothetical protein
MPNDPADVDAVAARAADYWKRIRAVMRELEGEQWPAGLAYEVDFCCTRRGRPFMRIGRMAYTLMDERLSPEEELVIEVRPTKLRIIGAGGVVVREGAVGDPERALFN